MATRNKRATKRTSARISTARATTVRRAKAKPSEGVTVVRKAKVAPSVAGDTDIVLALKTVNADMQSTHRQAEEFTYPGLGGRVIFEDFDVRPECGGGGHAFAKGVGDGRVGHYKDGAKALVLAIKKSAGYVEFKGKCKFKEAKVVFVGSLKDAAAYLLANGSAGLPVIGASVTVGDRASAVVGYKGTAVAGYRGLAVAGPRGSATAGANGVAMVGKKGIASVGQGGTLLFRRKDGSMAAFTAGFVANKRYSVNDSGGLVATV